MIFSDRKFIGVIPARSGSKGIKNKNILNFKGKPLILTSIEQAINSHFIDDVVLWTDSEEYLSIASEFKLFDVGLRTKYVDDSSVDWQFLLDLDKKLEKLDKFYDAYVLLRPTTPIREKKIIDKCIQYFVKYWDQYDSLRTVSKVDKTPYKMWFCENQRNGSVKGNPLCTYLTDDKEAHSLPRQALQEVWVQNCQVDIIKRDTIIKKSSAGSNILLYKCNTELVDIDNIEDFKNLGVNSENHS